MIKRNLLKIGCVVALTGLILTGCKTKDTGSTNETTTTIEVESTSEKESESESATEVETTTEIETEKVAEIEVTQPVTEAPKPAVTQPVKEAPKPAVTEAPKPAKTQPATEVPKPQPVNEAPKGSFDNPINDDTPKVSSKPVEPAEPAVIEEDHSRDDYNWAVKKVAEWKKINPDPCYLIGMFSCYAQSHWSYGNLGKWKHAISYYGTGVCEDIEICFRTFCDVAGIPCEQIIDWSIDHTWDKVTIDGVQYEVDMTSAICCPQPGQFNDLVEEFNLMYYGNESLGFTANRFAYVY